MATPDPTRGRQATSQRTDTALNLLADASILGVNDSIHHSPVDMNYGATVWARSDVPEAQSIADLELEGEMLRRALHEHQLGEYIFHRKQTSLRHQICFALLLDAPLSASLLFCDENDRVSSAQAELRHS